MIDWHSHILPDMDDGSGSIEESLSMLRLLKKQGVETVVLTSHYYADDEPVAMFLQRREKAFQRLQKVIQETGEDLPALKTGAEVLFYSGIAKLKDFSSLRIEGTDLLLLEMPFSRWPEAILREVEDLPNATGLTIVLAHIDRYQKTQKPETWERLKENGLLMQVNASPFTRFSDRRKAFSLFEEGYAAFLGSDCHNMTTRAPEIGKAFKALSRHFGEDFLDEMDRYGKEKLKEK